MKLDPFIWWSGRSLRKRTFQPGEYIGHNVEGKGATPPAPIEYLLDATFHRATGSLALSDGDVLSDNPGDAGHVFEIDKGSLTAFVGSAVFMDLQNSRLEYKDEWNYAGLWETTAVPLVAGDTIEVVMDSFAASTNEEVHLIYSDGLNATWDRGYYLLCGYNNQLVARTYTPAGTLVDDITIPSAFAASLTPRTLKLVKGGFDASGQPDPAGADGALYYFEGSLFYSTSFISASNFKATMRGKNSEPRTEYKAFTRFQKWNDTASIATPARSLFAQDHADIADYVPEDGPGWTVVSGDVLTSGGAATTLNAAAIPKAVIDLSSPAKYLEASYTVGNGTNPTTFLLLRYEGPADFWQVDILANSLRIVETVGGSGQVRSDVGGSNGTDGRYIATDDGSNITSIDGVGGNVGTYPSTAGQAATKAGIAFYSGGGSTIQPTVKWFCTRG